MDRDALQKKLPRMGKARGSRSVWCRCALGMILWNAFIVPSIFAEEPGSDLRALSDLFGEALSENALEVYRHAREQPLESRFQTLFKHVLPPETEDVRISIDFLPTNPSPPVVEKYGSAESPLLATEAQNRIPSGGVLISPALELVETARRLGKLQELREEILRRSPTGIEQIKARDAMLILVVAATADFEQYGILLNEFMTLVRESPIVDPQRAPEVVVVWQGASRHELRSEIREFVLMLHQQMKSHQYPHRERVKRHVFSLSHLLDERLVQSGRKNQQPVPRALTEQWHPVSRRTAWTQGNGFPNAAWSITPTRARHISSHGDDYLYFHVPLQGDYEVEGDLSTFGYRELHLAVGTIWAGPMYDLKTIEWGTFRENRPALKLDRQFANFEDRMRVRVTVRDGVRTTSVNGRKIFTHPQGPGSDPWISAHGPWPTSGVMENIRISGAPEIPSQINLLAVDDLPGWLPYFGESIGSPQKEWFLEQPQATGLLQRLFSSGDRSARILRGRKKRLLSGSFHESLLRYHRLMLEDGTIEYEFFYQPGESCVFPALDRLAFLFDSERVGIHWVTDGKFDPSGIDPANFTPVESGTPPSLVAGTWNRLRLSLTGDAVEIAVNGQRILSRELEPENLRTFGLFFYSDQTESRVRNLRWRGGWPKKLPALERQELADFSLEDELARGPELQTVFEYDFSQGLPLDKIWVTGHNWQELTEVRSDGLWMSRSGGIFERNNISLPFGLHGDFDVIWEFDEFQSTVTEEGNGNLHLLILLEDENATECRIYRKHVLPVNGKHKQIVQPSIFYTMPNGKTHYGFPVEFAEESAGGKLRLVRRGTTMYFLYAERNSDFYRLIHRAAVSDAAVMFGGIKGIIETHGEGETNALWKRVTVKAESVPTMLKSRAFTIEQLNRQRSQLPKSLSVDLNNETDPQQVDIWGEPTHVVRGNDGWVVRQPGFDTWKGSGVKPRVTLRGDFDISLELDVLKLEQSKPGSESTVYLHAGFDAAYPSSIHLKYSKAADSPRSLEIQMNAPGRDRGIRYDELKHLKADRVTQLRIARRGSVAYLIARRSENDEPEIFGRLEVGETDVPLDSLLACVHTGGAGQETVVRFKSLTIHTEQVMSPDTSP